MTQEQAEKESASTKAESQLIQPRGLTIFSSLTKIIIILFIAVSLFFLTAFFVILTLTKADDLVNVPMVKNQYLVDVYNTIIRSGLKVDLELVDIPELDKGYILSQSPAPGILVHPGEKLKLRVGRGVQFCKVPNLLGIALESAPALLSSVQVSGQSAELQIGQLTYAPSNEYAKGVIVAQVPGPEAKVRVRSNVHLLISTGPPQSGFQMANYVGQDVDIVYKAFELREIDLSYKIVKIKDKQKHGQIMEQTPAAGRRMEKGEKVTLAVGIFDEDLYHRVGYETIRYTTENDHLDPPLEIYIEDNYPRRRRYLKKVVKNEPIMAIIRREGDAVIDIKSGEKVLKSIQIKENELRD